MLKFKILNPQKMIRAYVCMKISEYPPTGIVPASNAVYYSIRSDAFIYET